ncbi:hypothetical protein PG993_012597 [Apiospora rasikravindrae]|uniref:Uncharacterized protein n=1 Tax=Apiospora rasikravindrae TaxID=990691 RepID=A0ABR1S4P3_9PEZI
MPDSFNSDSVGSSSIDPIDRMVIDDRYRPRTGSVDLPPNVPTPSLPARSPTPPPSRHQPPSASGNIPDAVNQDDPARDGPSGGGGSRLLSRPGSVRDGEPRQASERQRNLVIQEPSGNRVQYHIPRNARVAFRGIDPSDSWETSDNHEPPRRMRPERRRRSSRGPAGSLQEQEGEDDWNEDATETRAVHQPQPLYSETYDYEADQPYDHRRFSHSHPRPYRETPARQLGEMELRNNYRDFNPFMGKDYTSSPYFGGMPPYTPSTYPGQGLNYMQPVNYAPPGHYPPQHYPPGYGYPSPQPFTPYSYSQPPPWAQADRPAPPAPVRGSPHPGKDDAMNSELKRVLKELEDNKKKLADKDDLLQKLRAEEREGEILHKAKKTEARAQQKEEQAKIELDAAYQKRLEDEKQELSRQEYEEKLKRATQEAKEQAEQRLREEERQRKADEQRHQDLEAKLRRQIEDEMAAEQERQKREAENKLYLERQIRDKIIAERKEQEEMTLREELRKQQIEKRIADEFELKSRKAEELQQYKDHIEARLRMEAAQIIGAEKQKMDLESLRLEMQHRTDRIVRDTLNQKPDDSVNVNDFLDSDQLTAVSDGLQPSSTHSRMGTRSVHDGDNQNTQSPLYQASRGHPAEPMSPPMGTCNSLNAKLGSSLPNSQHTILGPSESVRHHRYNHSRNPFARQEFSYVGSQQHLHQPIPMPYTNPFGILRETAPMLPPSAFSSNINFPDPPIESAQFSPGPTESNLRSPIDSSLQAHVESSLGYGEGGDSSSFQRGPSKSRTTPPSTGGSRSPPPWPPHPDRLRVNGKPTSPRARDTRQAREESHIPRTRARGYSMALSVDTPLSPPDPDAAPAPTPPGFGSVGGSPAPSTRSGGYLPTGSVPSSYEGDHYYAARDYHSPVAEPQPARPPEARSSREFALLPEGSRPISGASQTRLTPQLKRMKKFSR